MNIIEPYAKILSIHGVTFDEDSDPGIRALQAIEWAGRISHRSEGAQTPDSWQRFIKAVVLDHGDWSIVEHVSATVDFLVDRGITHEIVRHRLFSFTQESTRFVNYEKKMPPSFVWPFSFPMSTHEIETTGEEGVWTQAIQQAEVHYRDLVSVYKVPPQIARSVFPNALASRLIMTGNLRNWRHMLLLRTTKEAHPQMRQVMIPLLAEFKKYIPILFDDIEPEQKQSANLCLPR